MTKPAPHPTFTRGDNRGLSFIAVLDEECVECYPANGGAKLGVVARTDNSETIHCTQCDHMTTRRLSPEADEFLPMNSRILNKVILPKETPAVTSPNEKPGGWLKDL